MTKRKIVPILQPGAEVRPIPGYEGLYAVTADGRVWSYAKSMGLSRHGGRWLRPGVTNGYPMVCLFKDQVQRMLSVHRAVALAWIPNPMGAPEVNHKDGDTGHCRAENLEWCTRSENNLHAYRTGLKQPARGPRKPYGPRKKPIPTENSHAL